MSTHSPESVSEVMPSVFNRHIAQYSLAAAAAGVSVLALLAPAAGEVVVTKKTIHIPLGTDGTPDYVRISMANNGVDNVTFSFYQSGTYRHLNARVANSGSAIRVGTGPAFDVYFGALRRGAIIGPSNAPSSFNEGGIIEISDSAPAGSSKFFRGSWAGSPKNRYLGVRFLINGQTHYGWIRLTVTTNPKPHTAIMSATITGYAYETVPNKAIAAGTAAIAASATHNPTAEVQTPKSTVRQGPSLGMLAAGADALPIWRREETQTPK